MKKNWILLSIFSLLAIVVFVIISNRSSGTLSTEQLADFAIKDTANINKIIITDQLGEKAVLEKVPGQKLWSLNGKYLAREDAVNLILTTCYRISVRGNVNDAARDNMMKLLVTSGKKVEFYMGGNEPEKIYYIGTPTPDHTGTIMLLEIPDKGRAQEPYIMHMEGFTGFLSTRFFADEMEWRYTGIYEYPRMDYNNIKVINNVVPEASLEVKYKGGNNIELYDNYNSATNSFNNKVEKFDTIAVKDFLLLFKKLHAESFNTQLNDESIDSLNKISPAYTVSLTENAGPTHKIDLFLKRAESVSYDENGNVNLWDQARLYGRLETGEFALVQTYNFTPILQPVQFYTSTRLNTVAPN